MEQFNRVEKWFAQQALQASSDPYQDVCDHYSDFISLLKTYTETKKERFSMLIGRDKMKVVLENIIRLLRIGLNTCSIWADSSAGVNHFCFVNRQIQEYKQELVDCGYKFDS